MTESETQLAEIAQKHSLLTTSVHEVDWLIARTFDLEVALRKIEAVAGGGLEDARCLRIHEIAHRAREGR